VKLVLDTNVVIDWLVFDDPFLASFREAVLKRRVTVVTDAHALDELRRVLAYRVLKLTEARRSEVLERYQAQATPLLAEPVAQAGAAVLPRSFPRCRDPDDIPFLTLAWQAQADALVSRDKALLVLKRRTARFGVRILDVPQMVAMIDALPPAGESSATLAMG
jgi:uncharacterized protein